MHYAVRFKAHLARDHELIERFAEASAQQQKIMATLLAQTLWAEDGGSNREFPTDLVNVAALLFTMTLKSGTMVQLDASARSRVQTLGNEDLEPLDLRGAQPRLYWSPKGLHGDIVAIGHYEIDRHYVVIDRVDLSVVGMIDIDGTLHREHRMLPGHPDFKDVFDAARVFLTRYHHAERAKEIQERGPRRAHGSQKVTLTTARAARA